MTARTMGGAVVAAEKMDRLDRIARTLVVASRILLAVLALLILVSKVAAT